MSRDEILIKRFPGETIINLQTALRESVADKIELETRLLMLVTSGSNWGTGLANAKAAAARTARDDLMKSITRSQEVRVDVKRTDEDEEV